MFNSLADVNWAALAPLFAIQVILMVIALIDLSKREQTRGPKWMWLLIILFLMIPGSIAYFIFGRGE